MSEAHSKTYFLPLGILLSLSAVVAFFAPRFLAFMPGIIGLLGLVAYRPTFGKWPDLLKYPLGWLLALLALSFSSVYWSIAPDDALGRAIKLAMIILSGFLLIGLDLKAGLFKPLSTLLPLLVFVLAVLLGVEFVTKGAIYKTLYPWPNPSKIMGDGTLNLSHYNRSTVFLALAFWPALSLLRKSSVAWRGDLILAMSAATVFAITLTESQTAQVGFAVATFFYFIFPVRFKFCWVFVLLTIIFVFMTLPDLAPLAFEYLPSMIKEVPWFENGYALERLDIWNALSQHIEDRPLLGHGIEATRNLDFGSALGYFQEKSVLHPHNFMLQTWLELGAVGVGFLMLFFIQAVQIFMRQPPTVARLNGTVFFSTIAMACTGYGMWQGWWLGLLMLLFVMCQVYAQHMKNA